LIRNVGSALRLLLVAAAFFAVAAALLLAFTLRGFLFAAGFGFRLRSFLFAAAFLLRGLLTLRSFFRLRALLRLFAFVLVVGHDLTSDLCSGAFAAARDAHQLVVLLLEADADALLELVRPQAHVADVDLARAIEDAARRHVLTRARFHVPLLNEDSF